MYGQYQGGGDGGGYSQMPGGYDMGMPGEYQGGGGGYDKVMFYTYIIFVQ